MLVSQFEYCRLRQFPISFGRNGDIVVLIKVRLQQLGKIKAHLLSVINVNSHLKTLLKTVTERHTSWIQWVLRESCFFRYWKILENIFSAYSMGIAWFSAVYPASLDDNRFPFRNIKILQLQGIQKTLAFFPPFQFSQRHP